MAQSEQDKQRLIEGLSQDVAQARQTVESGAAARGVAPPPMNEPSSFAPKAVRYQGMVIGQEHLAASQKAMKVAVDDILRTSSFANQQEHTAARMELTKRMNQFQLQIMKKAAELDARLKRSGYDQETKQATIKSFRDALQSTSAIAIAASGRQASPGTVGNLTPDQRQTADVISTEPGVGSQERAAAYDRYRGVA